MIRSFTQAQKPDMLSKFFLPYENSGLEQAVKARRIFFSNLIMSLICLLFVPFSLDEIWLLLIVVGCAIGGFQASTFLLRTGRLNMAATVHLFFASYLMVFLHMFISDSYTDTLTFICISFIFLLDGLLVSTHISQICLLGGVILLSQVIAPVVNINKHLQIRSELQLENLLIFSTFLVIALLVKRDSDMLLSIVKTESQKVKISRKKYLHLFESSMDAIMLISKDQKYTDCNRAALKLFNVKSKAEFLTLGPALLSPKTQPDGSSSKELAGRMIKKALKTGSHFFEWTHQRVDGETFDANVLLTAAMIADQKMVQATVRDISDRKKTEAVLIQSEKMMTVGGLAAGMAHEINNPLAGVMQNASVLTNRLTDKTMPANIEKAEAAGTSMEAIHRYMKSRGIPHMLDAINDAGTRMARIVENMLNFARKNETSFSTYNPALLMDNTLELASSDYDLKKQYDFKSIAIKKEYEPDLPMIACEGGAIQQVLFNILNNGAHAMFEKEKADETFQSTFIIRLTHDTAKNMLRIEITDNGTGMDAGTLDKIFEPFFTTKPAQTGTGLGLSIAYFIITKNHGGTLKAVSEPGRGSSFIIHLPYSRPSASSAG